MVVGAVVQYIRPVRSKKYTYFSSSRFPAVAKHTHCPLGIISNVVNRKSPFMSQANRKTPRSASLSLLACLLLLVANGCGSSSTGTVDGTITLEGKPLADAVITFSNEDNTVYAMANTDQKGAFQLVQGVDQTGLPAGEYQVAISTYVPANPDADPPTPEKPELIPAEFNLESTVKKVVTEGANEFHFAIPKRASGSPQ